MYHPEHTMLCNTGFFYIQFVLIMHYFLLQLTTSTLVGIGSCEYCFQVWSKLCFHYCFHAGKKAILITLDQIIWKSTCTCTLFHIVSSAAINKNKSGSNCLKESNTASDTSNKCYQLFSWYVLILQCHSISFWSFPNPGKDSGQGRHCVLTCDCH